MDKSSLIQDFIDGSLSKPQEDELFAQLNINEELRGELRNSVNIDKAFDKKLSSFAPSAKTTMNLFSQMGFVPPPSVPAPIATKGNSLSNFLKKYSQGMKGALITGVAAIVIYFLLPWQGGDDGKIAFLEGRLAQYEKTAKESAAENSLSLTPKAPLVSSSEIESSANKEREVKTVIKYVYVDRPKAEEVAYNSIPFTDKIRPEIVSLSYNTVDLTGINNASSALNPIPQANYSSYGFGGEDLREPDERMAYSEEKDWLLELRNSQYWNSAEADDLLTTDAAFQNIGGAVFLRIADDWAVGLDIRQEKFYQKFNGRDEFGDLYEYRQYPNFIGISAALRYELIQIKNLNLYSQLMLGGVQTGLTGRGMLGLEYALTPSAGMIFGAEGSFLFYLHEKNMFMSPKFGIHYGLTFKL